MVTGGVWGGERCWEHFAGYQGLISLELLENRPRPLSVIQYGLNPGGDNFEVRLLFGNSQYCGLD